MKVDQTRQQARIFDSIFSKEGDYRLYAWNKSYIKRIQSFLLKKNFKKKTLLDIGAGSAYVTVEMAKMGVKVIALDISRAALDNIARYKTAFKLKNISLVHTSGAKIPLKNNSVDYIVANAILEHIEEENSAISEWKRVLKPGGRMMVTVPLKFRYLWPFFWPVNYIRDKQVGHLRRYDIEELKDKFGMKVVRYFYTGHMIKALWVIFSTLTNYRRFDEEFEIIDELGKDNLYGASNIVVIFEK